MAIALPLLVSGEFPFVGASLAKLSTGEIAFTGVKVPSILTAEMIPESFSIDVSGGCGIGGSALSAFFSSSGSTLTYDPEVPSGGTIIGGSATVAGLSVSVVEIFPQGGIAVSGSAIDQFNWTRWTPSSGVAASGAALVVATTNPPMVGSGGTVVAGTAAVTTLAVNIYNVFLEDAMPDGGCVVGGTAAVAENIPHVPAGGLNTGGVALIKEVIPFLASGGVAIGGTAAAAELTAIKPAGGISIGGTAAIASVTSIAPASGVSIGGTAVASTYQAFHGPTGGVQVSGRAVSIFMRLGDVLTPENPLNEDFNGWAINVETAAPTRYSRFPANSFAFFNGVTIVANAAGIYKYGADDDAGQPIKAVVRLARTDYGEQRDKSMPDVFMGLKAAAPLALQVRTSKSEETIEYEVPSSKSFSHAVRAKLGRGLKGRYWDLALTNPDGVDFEIESISIPPLILSRHGR